MASKYSMNDRPSWPRRAIVTAGEPYGNKGLHFGHVGGVFVPADFFARFLRDRLGRENGIFTSGTDCYGSPIMESYRKLKENEGYDKSIGEYVESNHSRQAATLNNYNISCDIYGGSGLEPAAQIHNEVTAEIIERLHEQGTISKRSTLQFYDAKAGTFLNGRQVIGRCPIQGCKSEKAYADECDLGHSYAPEDLIAPKSSLTGTTPEMRPVENWYFDLPAFADFLRARVAELLADADYCDVSLVEGVPNLYIKVTATAGGHTAVVEITDHHTNVTCHTLDGIPVCGKSAGECAACAERVVAERAADNADTPMSIETIIDFIEDGDIEDARAAVERQIELNGAISAEGLAHAWGAEVGRTLLGARADDVACRARARAAALCNDLRNIRRKIADSFHIRNHLERRRDHAHIRSDGLLGEQQF